MFKGLLSVQTRSLGLASFILSAAYLISAILGLVRDRILAAQFGAGRELDIYYAAFRIPDLVATVFIFGAITAAIIPIFTARLKSSEAGAWSFAVNLLNIFTVLLIPICLVLMLAAPLFINYIAPGFTEAERITTIALLRIMFLSPLLLGISNIISAILQVYKRFLVTALSPIIYNLGIISGALFLVPVVGLAGLAWGVVLGGAGHLLLQMPSFWRSGYKFRWMINFHDPDLKKVLALMAPRSLGLMAGQVNLIIITAIASFITPGAIAVFTLAANLSGTATNLVAVSLATAIFPVFSSAFAEKKEIILKKNISLSIRVIIYILTPVSVILFLLRDPVVRFFLGAGHFRAPDIEATAACLGVFCFGIIAQGLILIILRAFYAIQNTTIPAIISGIAVAVNYGLCQLLLTISHKIGGSQSSNSWFEFLSSPAVLALALTLTSLVQLAILAVMLYHKIGDYRITEIWESVWRILTAGLVSGALGYLVLNWINWPWILEAALGLITVSCAYLLMSRFLGIKEWPIVWSFLKLRKNIYAD